MKLMELYFKAFRLFRKETKDNDDSKKLRTAIIHSNHENEIFTTIKYECNIDVEWVDNIEEGLDFVRKAINEERQFIRSEGEVIPIEKVKRVSKSSVEHLSRHSNYITRKPRKEDDGIIPEKLYIVEKLSDYLVYENRFLYLLLCYVKDFIELRLNSIRDKTSTYKSTIQMDKNIEERSRNIKYKLEYSDVIKNDPYLIEQFREIPHATRVENIYAIAVSLLATPLMKAVAKAPLIKPPITKTNVLRMNQNFKAALKLYDYITAYNKKGYEIIETTKTFKPFTDDMDDEIAETIELTSVIGYLTGNDIREELNEKLEELEKEQLKELDQKKIAELNRLKKRIIEMNEDPTKYIYLLEKRNAELEKNNMAFAREQEKNAELTIKVQDLRNEQLSMGKLITDLQTALHEKEFEIEMLNQTYYDDMVEAEQVHQNELERLTIEHNKTLATIEADQQKHEQKLYKAFQNELENASRKHKSELQYSIDKYELRMEIHGKNILSLEDEITSLLTEIDQYKSLLHERDEVIEKLEEETRYLNARYLALRTKQGLLTDEDDFTSKEHFKELEQEMKAYKKLFKEQWKKAKSNIRESIKQETIAEIKKQNQKKK